MTEKRKCPCCDGELEQVKENELYCATDDLTIRLDKGRLVFKPESKGKVQEIEEKIASLEMDVQTLGKKLFGNAERDFWE